MRILDVWLEKQAADSQEERRKKFLWERQKQGMKIGGIVGLGTTTLGTAIAGLLGNKRYAKAALIGGLGGTAAGTLASSYLIKKMIGKKKYRDEGKQVELEYAKKNYSPKEYSKFKKLMDKQYKLLDYHLGPK